MLSTRLRLRWAMSIRDHAEGSDAPVHSAPSSNCGTSGLRGVRVIATRTIATPLILRRVAAYWAMQFCCMTFQIVRLRTRAPVTDGCRLSEPVYSGWPSQMGRRSMK